MLGALLETDVGMEGEILGVVLVAYVHWKNCIKWQSSERC